MTFCYLNLLLNSVPACSTACALISISSWLLQQPVAKQPEQTNQLPAHCSSQLVAVNDCGQIMLGKSKSENKNDNGTLIFNTNANTETLNGRYQTQTSPGVYVRTRNDQQIKKSGKAFSGALIALGILSILVQIGILCAVHE